MHNIQKPCKTYIARISAQNTKFLQNTNTHNPLTTLKQNAQDTQNSHKTLYMPQAKPVTYYIYNTYKHTQHTTHTTRS